MSETIDTHVAKLIYLLETKYISTPGKLLPLDFAEKAHFFTLDVIGDLAFGESFGAIENDHDPYDFIKTTHAFFPFAIVLGCLPSLISVLHSPMFRWLLPKESDKLGFGAFIACALPPGS